MLCNRPTLVRPRLADAPPPHHTTDPQNGSAHLARPDGAERADDAVGGVCGDAGEGGERGPGGGWAVHRGGDALLGWG